MKQRARPSGKGTRYVCIWKTVDDRGGGRDVGLDRCIRGRKRRRDFRHGAQASKTLKFISVATNMSTPTKSGAFYVADVDYSGGLTVGQDIFSCQATSSSAATCNGALAPGEDGG
jgi:hypothetical protein